HAEVPARHARPTRLRRARAPGRPRARRLVQRRPLPRRPRTPASRRRALRSRRRHRRGPPACPRRGVRTPSRALPTRAPDAEAAASGGVDQPTADDEHRSVWPDRTGSRSERDEGGRCSVISRERCLKLVDARGGRTTTTFLDELGRTFRQETTLGASYGGQSVVTSYRTCEGLGRVAFEAVPFLASESPATAYGTSRYYQTDGTPNCFVRAQGPHALTAVSDPSTETFATCFYHGF